MISNKRKIQKLKLLKNNLKLRKSKYNGNQNNAKSLLCLKSQTRQFYQNQKKRKIKRNEGIMIDIIAFPQLLILYN